MRDVVIFGAGNNGKLLYRIIEKRYVPQLDDMKVDAFVDNHFPAGNYVEGLSVIRPHQLSQYKNCNILISSARILDEVMAQLYHMGVENEVFFVPEYVLSWKWNDSLPSIVKMDISKPRLPWLEIKVFAKCNLNCKGCTALANIRDPWRMEPEELEKDFIAIREKFSGIKYLKLFGGEPLLHGKLGRLLEISRKYFPDSELEVHSNGLPVPNASEELLKTMHTLNVGFVFTLYPETGKKRNAIILRCGQYGVGYRFMPPVYQFHKVINPRGDYDPAEAYARCWKCINLDEGCLSCGRGFAIDRLEKHYNVSICENKFEHCVNIHTTELDGWQINTLLNSPCSLCSYCALVYSDDVTATDFYDWVPYAEGKLEDWIL